MGISSSELIVGEGPVFADGRYHTHAFAYQDGAMTDLGSLPGAGEDSGATSVSHSGEIAGWMNVSLPFTSRTHAFVYRDGMITDLGTLPGDVASRATAINASGQIAGWSEAQTISAWYFYSVGRRRAVLVEHGVMRDLGTLPGTDYSQAQGINDSGWVVGYSYDAMFRQFYAFVWTPLTLMTELPLLDGCTSAFAFAINSAGTIAGYSSGCADGAITRATLWEPIHSLPEPGSGLALIAGAVLLGGLDRRRRRVRWCANVAAEVDPLHSRPFA
jgi:probable HAF family extracellular repeat protein